MKYLFFFLLTIMTIQQAMANKCHVHTEYDQGEALDSHKKYTAAIKKFGHKPASKEEANLFIEEIRVKNQSDGVFFFKGEGQDKNIVFNLKNREGEIIASVKWFSCHLTTEDLRNKSECGPFMTYDHYIGIKAMKIEKLLEGISC